MLKNTAIKLKILAVILLLSLVACIGLAHLSNEFWKTDVAYSHFISGDAMGALQTSRASGGTMVAVLQVARAGDLAPRSPQMAAARQTFEKFIDTSTQRMVDSAKLVPGTKTVSDDIIARLANLRALGRKAFDAFDAGDLQTARGHVAEVYSFMDQITPLFVSNNDVMTKALVEGSDGLTDETISTITWSLSILAIGILAAIAASMFVAQAGITTPLTRLRERMISLADGNTADEISGIDRKDEVGKMAASVAVFRTNAIDRLRLEQQTEADRSLSERDRMERETQKAKEAANLQAAIQVLGQALVSLASGDLTHRIDQPFTAELDALRQDFNVAIAKLNEALQAVDTNATAIAARSNQIRSSADDLSRRTEQQAASVEETAAALEQITTTVKDASDRANEARGLVARTREGAEKSGEVVRNAVQAMHQIEQSSNEISNIIGVIDDIAFQTNLLALNAGVEAARAGEAGKGFAVVAQEVRELAQRSAKAAKEIKALITTSGMQVQAGVSLVGDTGKALDVIVKEVQEINGHVHAIAEASREQSIGLQEINTAVNTMDQGTQQNAAMVEETTAASHSLASEAAALSQLMSQFNLGSGSHSQGLTHAKVVANARPVASPARELGQKVAHAFRGNAAVKQEQEWSEF
ncbi:methyl-accepting chemotaxis protein [Neorhizobium galegae]|uniref:methyl-accepting chemotaxis protein n=2 Tax=Neorhizobium galegae TaxID=399 RepID=UPI000622791D|nr:methyl-accepting chemotaxis protein [Neorhizobium galegae]MCQ1798557.1 methyl-accepting chemotaxis protein [Neorhizobium galegae]CDZ30391.1 Chemoreceptor McpA [Neorhizobium galegae bv. officinalis]